MQTTRQGPGQGGWFWLVVFLTVFALLSYVIALVEPGQHLRQLDIVERFSLFNVDDAYRYYLAGQVWHNFDLYTWNYLLPVPLFLDGMLVTLWRGDISAVRLTKLVITFAGLFMLYLSARSLSQSRHVAAASVLVLALMPAWMFVSIGFLGESWLSLCLIMALFFFLRGWMTATALCASLLPLIRPEGLWLIAPLAVLFLCRRQYRCLILLGLPGLLYLLWLLYALEDFSDYYRWRFTYRQYAQYHPVSGLHRPGMFFITFNGLFLAVAAWGAWRAPQMMCLRPFLYGAVLWVTAFCILVLLHRVFYEPRYFTAVMPVLALAFGAGLSTIKAQCNRRYLNGALVALVLFVLINHLLQIDTLRQRYTNGVRLPLFSTTEAYDLARGTDSAEALDIAHVLVHVYEELEAHPHIDAIFIPMERDTFYWLDKQRLGQAREIILPVSYSEDVARFGGSFYGMYPSGRQYGYFSFAVENETGRRRAGIYLGQSRACRDFDLISRAGSFSACRVFYAETEEPLKWPVR